MRKFSKPIKRIVLSDCVVRFEEEADGVVLHVIPVTHNEDGTVTVLEKGGVCRSIIDPWGNLIGCQDVGACQGGCRLCTFYDSQGNEIGEGCRCGKCPDPPPAPSPSPSPSPSPES